MPPVSVLDLSPVVAGSTEGQALRDTIELARRTAASLVEGGTVVAVHWRGQIDEWALPAEQAHAILRETGELSSVVQHLEPQFLLEVFQR